MESTIELNKILKRDYPELCLQSDNSDGARFSLLKKSNSTGKNIPPYCDPNVQDRGTKIVIAPNCRDDDGNIVATYYSWDGQSELRGYSRISFNKSEFPNNTVTLRTVDNGGEEVVDVVTW